MPGMFARELFSVGPLVVTDTLVTSVAISMVLVVFAVLLRRSERAWAIGGLLYESLENSVVGMVNVNVRPLVPLILTQWIFLGVANLVGLLPGLDSPTRDPSVTLALALIALLAGHIHAFRERGLAYLRTYLEPNPLLLPFNVVGELSRTLALALRLFGNVLSGELIGAILVYLVGILLPVPLMLLSVLTGIVQAYIFGVLTLVFAASSLQVVASRTTGERVE